MSYSSTILSYDISPALISVVMAIATLVASYGFYRRYRLWRLGQPDPRFDRLWDRTDHLIGYLWTHGRFFRESYPGWMHLCLFWGLAVLFLGAAIEFALALGHDLFGFPALSSLPRLAVALVIDLAALVALVGVALAAYRRYILRPERLDNRAEDALALFALAFAALSRLVADAGYIATADPRALAILRWLHSTAMLGTLAYLFWSKLAHVIFAALAMFFRPYYPRGALLPIPHFEARDSFGAANIEDLTWKNLLDLDACTRCGRCQDHCPAYLSGKPLSPKALVQDMKAHLPRRAALLRSEADAAQGPRLAGGVIAEDTIWACTTCDACMSQCPIFIEHLAKLIEMRRYLVMMEARMPETVRDTLVSIETRGHPWRGTPYTRTDWAQGLDIPRLSAGQGTDLLFWVGCTGALVDRNMRVTLALAEIMRRAGLSFAILGDQEWCCGDPCRRMGNEYLYRTVAQRNIGILKGYDVQRVLTACPHCYNTFKNEYPQLGGHFEVMHHTELIAELLRQGRLKLGQHVEETVAYHDPCYLGRQNDIFDEPRQILGAIPGLHLVEMERHRERSFCCGAGGGHCWMTEPLGEPINRRRVQQLLETKATIAALACPMCLESFEDGLRAEDAFERVAALDIAELVIRALE